ncbi:MAG: Sir2 family NAD-dependent protein deacetylase [Saprospiraceae bacterium]
MEKIVVLTGAGMSAESGLKTFRDSDGLWENHRIEDVATPDAWHRNPHLVLEFYNQRRKQLNSCAPNSAHQSLVLLEEKYDVQIITQNVDDLHERAGSIKVIHLHGELFKVRSTLYPELIYDWTDDLNIGELCQRGGQLRPHIVWFGEEVPLLERAIEECMTADYCVIIGTSMQVYPAASLIRYVHKGCKIWYIDPKPHISHELSLRSKIRIQESSATEGVRVLVAELLGPQ